jgi:WD40 repeat protein
MPTASTPPYEMQITPLATLSPSSTTRCWLTSPHPTLPIVATACSDKTVRIYSLTSFTLLSTISGGHKRSVRSCAWKPNTKGESVLATGSFDASAGIWRRWDVEVDGEVQDFTRNHGGDDDDEEDEDEWRFSVILDGHESEIKSVAWSAGGQYLATCARDKTVWIWEEIDDDNFETIAVMQEHDADVKCVAWHPQEDLLASGSYDDTIRLYREDLDDWTCVSVMKHEATVWTVLFEPLSNVAKLGDIESLSEEQKSFLDKRKKSGPRLLSCSDDLSIRLWRRTPKVHEPLEAGKVPSILNTNNIEEDWFEDARLPQTHERAIYSVDWSQRSGMIVSTGSDGKVIVYKERWKTSTESDASSTTEWYVAAELEASHDVFEANHVCWALRRDKNKKRDDEEVIISTGDDGEVKVWVLEEG